MNMQTEATEKGEGATVQAARPIIIETPCDKTLSPVIDAEAWVTAPPSNYEGQVITTDRCGTTIQVNRYEDARCAFFINTHGGVSVALHMGETEMRLLRDDLGAMFRGCGQ
jgi:hypothetical protein